MTKHVYWQVPLAAFLAFHAGFNIAYFVFIFFGLIVLTHVGRSIRAGTFTFRRVMCWWWFLKDFSVDMAKSNFLLALDVLTVHTDLHRVYFVKVPIDDLSDAEAVFLAHRITLTPGTLACGITEDRNFLIVHAMYNVTKDTPSELRRPMDMIKYGGPRPS